MNKRAKNNSPENYESKINKIEEIIETIETGNLEMTAMFESFSQAKQYLHECEDFLKEKQKQLNLDIETLPGELDF